MGPPSTGFVRKTRKSMASVHTHTEITIDEVVAIPESETPMIRKNRELREAQARRSSLGMRGQRASSSLGRGDLSTLLFTFLYLDPYNARKAQGGL